MQPAAQMEYAAAPQQAQPEGGTKDLLLERELDHLDQVAHIQPTSDGMEQQIQQLVEGQRHILMELEKLKECINDNAVEVQDLQRVAGHAKEYMGKPPQFPMPPQQMQQTPSPTASTKSAKKETKTSAAGNMGYTGQIGSQGIMDTLSGHYNTMSSYMGRPQPQQ